MIVLWIIFGIIIFIIISFQSDKNKVAIKNLEKGGLIKKYPEFVKFCTDPLSIYEETKMQFVRDTGRYLEYKLPIKRDSQLRGYIYYGLENSFGTFAYCYAISTNGYKTEKSFIEIKPLLSDFELSQYEYRELFDNLLKSSLFSSNYKKLNFDLN